MQSTYMRNEIENVIKNHFLDRSRCFECPKTTYHTILTKIEQTFVSHGGKIHWSNMGRFNEKLSCKTKSISEEYMWFIRLPDIIPELICILSEVNGLKDFYIISKKFDWLIRENHENIVSFVGDSLHLSCC